MRQEKPQRIRKGIDEKKTAPKNAYSEEKMKKIMVPNGVAAGAPNLPPLPKKRKNKSENPQQKKKRRISKQ